MAWANGIRFGQCGLSGYFRGICNSLHPCRFQGQGATGERVFRPLKRTREVCAGGAQAYHGVGGRVPPVAVTSRADRGVLAAHLSIADQRGEDVFPGCRPFRQNRRFPHSYVLAGWYKLGHLRRSAVADAAGGMGFRQRITRGGGAVDRDPGVAVRRFAATAKNDQLMVAAAARPDISAGTGPESTSGRQDSGGQHGANGPLAGSDQAAQPIPSSPVRIAATGRRPKRSARRCRPLRARRCAAPSDRREW